MFRLLFERYIDGFATREEVIASLVGSSALDAVERTIFWTDLFDYATALYFNRDAERP